MQHQQQQQPSAIKNRQQKNQRRKKLCRNAILRCSTLMAPLIVVHSMLCWNGIPFLILSSATDCFSLHKIYTALFSEKLHFKLAKLFNYTRGKKRAHFFFFLPSSQISHWAQWYWWSCTHKKTHKKTSHGEKKIVRQKYRSTFRRRVQSVPHNMYINLIISAFDGVFSVKILRLHKMRAVCSHCSLNVYVHKSRHAWFRCLQRVRTSKTDGNATNDDTNNAIIRQHLFMTKNASSDYCHS